MAKQRDCALMLALAGVVMEQLVQRGAGRHGVQQQDNTHEHRGDDRLAASQGMVRYEPHSKSKLADVMPDARPNLGLRSKGGSIRRDYPNHAVGENLHIQAGVNGFGGNFSGRILIQMFQLSL